MNNDLKKFGQTLLASAEQAFKAGEITRLDMMKVRRACRRERILLELQEESIQQAVCEGIISNEVTGDGFTAIDWEKFAEFIKTILPILLQLLVLFL